ncbi:DegT/DnrJ/EryC1/StrS family aminotransferase [Pseudomonas asuensis]
MKPLPRKAFFDTPPTAGLPLQLRDLLPGGDSDLSAALARFLGVEQVHLESSGTAALVIALTALKRLSPIRTTVIVPAYTCPLVALAVAQCGLELQLCDLKPDSLDLDPSMLKALCNEQTLAVVPTHLCGRISDIDPALECARAVGAWVIEDAAQGLGSRVGGHSIGTRSDIAFFSLAVGKGLTIFEGGALIARDETVRQALRHASQTLAQPKPWLELKRSVELLGYAALYRPTGLRLAYGLPLRRALKKGDWVAAADEYFPAYYIASGRVLAAGRGCSRTEAPA